MAKRKQDTNTQKVKTNAVYYGKTQTRYKDAKG